MWHRLSAAVLTACLVFYYSVGEAAYVPFPNPQNVSQVAAQPTAGTLQSAAVANGAGTVLSTVGEAVAILTVNCSSCSGGTTVTFKGSQDGTNYTAINAAQLGTNTISSTTATAGLTYWQVPVSGLSSIEAVISAYSAGTVTVTGTTSPVTYDPNVSNTNIVSYPATNQGTNVAQVNGVTALTGAGATGTGAQRVTTAQDTTTIAGSAPGTAGTASANVVSVQGAASMTPVQVSPTTSANAVGNPFYVAPGTSANFAGAAPMQSTGGTVGLVAGSALVGIAGIEPDNLRYDQRRLAGSSMPDMLDRYRYPHDDGHRPRCRAAAPTSGLYAYVTGISCSNTGAAATTVLLQNGSGGSTIWEWGNLPITTGAFIDEGGMTAIAGGDTTLGGGMTVATAVYIKIGTASTSVICTVHGYNAL